MASEDDKDTQPTITAVFRLIQDVEARLNSRLDESEARFNARLDESEARFNARLDESEARFNTRLDESEARLNARLDTGFKEVTHKMNALNRRALQQEADYEDLFERIQRLETKAS